MDKYSVNFPHVFLSGCLSGCLFLFSYIYLWTLKEVHFICFVCMLHLYPMFFNTDDPCYIHTLKNNITKTPTCRFSHWFLSDQSQVQQPLQFLLQTRVRQKMNLFLTLAVITTAIWKRVLSTAFPFISLFQIRREEHFS